MSFREDYRAMREYRTAGELSFPRWLGQAAGAHINEGFLWRDPRPGLAALGAAFSRRVARLLGRARKP